MTSRLGAVALVLLVAISLPLVSPPAAAQSSSCVGDTTLRVTQALEITSAQTWSCTEVVLANTVTVRGGGVLTIANTTVRFDPNAGALHLRVHDGGDLRANNTTFRSNVTDTNLGRLIVEETGKGLVGNSTIADYESLEIRAAQFTLLSVTLDNPATVAARITAGAARLENVTVRSALTAFRAEGTARPTFISPVLDDVALIGLHARDEAVAVSEGGDWESATAIDLGGNATVRLRNATLSGLPVEARLESTNTSRPRLVLEGTPHDPDKVNWTGSPSRGLLDVFWFVDARVINAATSNAINGATVRLRNATQSEFAVLTTQAPDGYTPMALVPAQSYAGGPDNLTDHNPWTLIVRSQSSAGQSTTNITQSGSILHALTIDSDTSPPVFPDDTGALEDLQSRLGYSSDGRVRLAWDNADDTLNGSFPDRGIDVYEIAWVTSSQEAVVRVPSNNTTLSGFDNGTVRVRVRPVDLMGTPGNYSNEVAIVVDRRPPTLSYTLNQTHQVLPGYLNVPFNLTFAPADVGSGHDTTLYRLADDGPWIAYQVGTPVNITDSGRHNLTVRVTDRAGGANDTRLTLVLDQDAPLMSFQLNPAIPTGRNGWYVAPPELRVASSDVGAAGLHEIRLRNASQATWQTINATARLTMRGESPLDLQVVDRAGNTATSTFVLRLDNELPQVNASLEGTPGDAGWFRSPVRVVPVAVDAISGIDTVSYRLGQGTWNEFSGPLTLGASGSHRVTLQGTDRAGNPSGEAAVVVPVDLEPPVVPAPLWTIEPDGRVRIAWADGAPFDLVSGVGRLTLQQTDATGTLRRQLDLDASLLDAHLAGPFELGTHQFSVRVSDRAGNAVTTASTPIQILETAGGLQGFDGPKKVRGVATIRYVPLGDFEPVEVLLYVGDTLVAATATEPFDFEWDTRNLQDGSYVARIVATDASGRTAEESATYEVRNSYAHTVQDNLLPFAAAVVAAMAALVLAVLARRTWRQGEW